MKLPPSISIWHQLAQKWDSPYCSTLRWLQCPAPELLPPLLIHPSNQSVERLHCCGLYYFLSLRYLVIELCHTLQSRIIPLLTIDSYSASTVTSQSSYYYMVSGVGWQA